MPLLNQPPQGIGLEDEFGLFSTRDGQRREQEPFNRVGRFRRGRFPNMNNRHKGRFGAQRFRAFLGTANATPATVVHRPRCVMRALQTSFVPAHSVAPRPDEPSP